MSYAYAKKTTSTQAYVAGALTGVANYFNSISDINEFTLVEMFRKGDNRWSTIEGK